MSSLAPAATGRAHRQGRGNPRLVLRRAPRSEYRGHGLADRLVKALVPENPGGIKLAEMAALVTETERARQALGRIHYGPTEDEKPSIRFRRSIYIAQDVKAGDVLTRENLRVIRPGYGLAPKHYASLLGRPVNRDLAMGTAMAWDYL